VMYAHRGAYLNALGEIIHQRFDPESVYLWTVMLPVHDLHRCRV
jgi:fatty-acyl-CoA synthase